MGRERVIDHIFAETLCELVWIFFEGHAADAQVRFRSERRFEIPRNLADGQQIESQVIRCEWWSGCVVKLLVR